MKYVCVTDDKFYRFSEELENKESFVQEVSLDLAFWEVQVREGPANYFNAKPELEITGFGEFNFI